MHKLVTQDSMAYFCLFSIQFCNFFGMCLPAPPEKPVYFKHRSECFSVGGSEGRAFSPVCFSGINTNRHRWDKQGKSSRLHFCPLRHLQDMALLKCVVRNIFCLLLTEYRQFDIAFSTKTICLYLFLCAAE